MRISDITCKHACSLAFVRQLAIHYVTLSGVNRSNTANLTVAMPGASSSFLLLLVRHLLLEAMHLFLEAYCY